MLDTNARRREIGEERRGRMRTKLLAAAAQVIAERGEKKATIDDFIAAAGVARGTFYNYYSTRQAILDDLWESIGREPFAMIQRASAKIEDPAERLIAEARLVLRLAGERPAWGWLVYALSADAATVNADLLAYPRPDLEIGRRAGRFTFDSLAAASDMVVGAVRAALRTFLDAPQSSQYVDTFGMMLLKALGIGEEEAATLCLKPLPDILDGHEAGSKLDSSRADAVSNRRGA